MLGCIQCCAKAGNSHQPLTASRVMFSTAAPLSSCKPYATSDVVLPHPSLVLLLLLELRVVTKLTQCSYAEGASLGNVHT